MTRIDISTSFVIGYSFGCPIVLKGKIVLRNSDHGLQWENVREYD